jgi:hypothetical protein
MKRQVKSRDEVKGDQPGAESKEQELGQDHEAKEMEVAKKQRSRRRRQITKPLMRQRVRNKY